MNTVRALVDAEAVMLGYLGAGALLMPDAVVRLTTGDGANAPIRLVVSLMGAVLLTVAGIQLRVIALEYGPATRVVLRARMISDVLAVGLAWWHRDAMRGMSSVLALELAAALIVFAAVRFYALVLITDGAGQVEGEGALG